jgi:hypothetical protein
LQAQIVVLEENLHAALQSGQEAGAVPGIHPGTSQAA